MRICPRGHMLRCVMGTKVLIWLYGEVKSPPFSKAARVEAGWLLRRVQLGESLGMPHSKPMPDVGPNCHELRVPDHGTTWRLMYAVQADAVVILEVFRKKTRKTPQPVFDACRTRLQRYLRDEKGTS